MVLAGPIKIQQSLKCKYYICIYLLCIYIEEVAGNLFLPAKARVCSVIGRKVLANNYCFLIVLARFVRL